MRSLTPDQRPRLDALMAGLETLPTPELIAESGRLRCEMPLDEVGKRRMRLALSGAFAAEKIMAYIQALDDVDDHRGKIGRQVFERRREGERLRALQSLEAANHLVMAAHLAGRQEVDFHFFAVCVGRLERFLPLAARAAGDKIPKEDRALLAPFRKLRDYYEHLEDRLPGGKSAAEAVTETHDAHEWRVRMEPTLEGQERIILDGVAVDVRAGWQPFGPFFGATGSN